MDIIGFYNDKILIYEGRYSYNQSLVVVVGGHRHGIGIEHHGVKSPQFSCLRFEYTRIQAALDFTPPRDRVRCD